VGPRFLDPDPLRVVFMDVSKMWLRNTTHPCCETQPRPTSNSGVSIGPLSSLQCERSARHLKGLAVPALNYRPAVCGSRCLSMSCALSASRPPRQQWLIDHAHIHVHAPPTRRRNKTPTDAWRICCRAWSCWRASRPASFRALCHSSSR